MDEVSNDVGFLWGHRSGSDPLDREEVSVNAVVDGQNGFLTVMERHDSSTTADVTSGRGGREVVLAWQDASGERDLLQFANLLAVREKGDVLEFYEHGGRLSVEVQSPHARNLVERLVHAKLLERRSSKLLLPGPTAPRRLFERPANANESSLGYSSDKFNATTDAVQSHDSTAQSVRRSLMKTASRVPKMISWLRHHDAPTSLAELRLAMASAREADLDPEPMSPSIEVLTPVYHFAKFCRGIPVTAETFETYLLEDGVLRDPEMLQLAVQAGGLSADCRAPAWPFIVGVYPWNSTGYEREMATSIYVQEYRQALDAVNRRVCGDAALDAKENSDGTLEEHPLTQIRKDVQRTDRDVAELEDDDSPLLVRMEEILHVYAILNPDIGYCQGMSDMLSPILWVLRDQDSSVAYRCFEEMMKRGWARNFQRDGSGIHSQLVMLQGLVELADPALAEHFGDVDPNYHCLYRWVLVQFKRELDLADLLKLWEVIWLDWELNLHLYVALGILLRHRDHLINICTSFDRLLKCVNLMSRRTDVELALQDALVLRKKYRLPSMGTNVL